MHARQILTALVLLAVVSGASAQSGKSGRSPKVEVYQEFQLKLEQLEKKLPQEKTAAKRYDLFMQTYQELLELRKKNPRQAESQELNMSLFVDTLSPLPAKKDFQAKKCSEYLQEVRAGAKSYAPQKEPFVDRAVKLAESICK